MNTRPVYLDARNQLELEFEFEQTPDSAGARTGFAVEGRSRKATAELLVEGVPPEDFALAKKAQGRLRRFAEFCKRNERGASRMH